MALIYNYRRSVWEQDKFFFYWILRTHLEIPNNKN